MSQIIGFALVVGIGSTIVLDLWVTLIQKLLGIPPTNWGMVGRWLRGLMQLRFFLNTANTSSPTTQEKILGWLFHYAVGIAYAVLILMLYGNSYITSPTLLPALMVGAVISTLAGLMILMPAMGGGLFARKTPTPFSVILYVVVAHIIFALAQYAFAVMNVA